VKHMMYLTSAPWILGGATPLNIDIVNKNSKVGVELTQKARIFLTNQLSN
jgi:hypothetical protein